MIIKCLKSGGFMGQTWSCEILMEELNDTEKRAFQCVILKNVQEVDSRDTFKYYFILLEEKERIKKEVSIEESSIEEEMLPFIKKVDSKLK